MFLIEIHESRYDYPYRILEQVAYNIVNVVCHVGTICFISHYTIAGQAIDEAFTSLDAVIS